MKYLTTAFIAAGVLAAVIFPASAAPIDAAATGVQAKPGRVLLQVVSHRTDYMSHVFKAPRSGWRVSYAFRCSGANGPLNSVFIVTGVDPRHDVNELGMVYALGSANKGTSDRVRGGRWKVHINTLQGCIWTVTVRAG